MKIFITILCSLLFSAAVAQFASINDRMGLAMEEVKQTALKIVDTLHNGHLVYIFETKGNRTEIDYS